MNTFESAYSVLIEKVSQLLTAKIGNTPEIHSRNEYFECYGESVTFEYEIGPNISELKKYMLVLREIYDEVITGV